MSVDTVQYIVAKYWKIVRSRSPSLKRKRVTPHVFRHAAAMELLQASVDCLVIALWLGNEPVQTTQEYLYALLALKEAALVKIIPVKGGEVVRYHPGDQLLQFRNML